MTVLTKNCTLPEVSEKEVARYALAPELDRGLLADCLSEIKGLYSGKVCYTRLDVKTEDGLCDFGLFKVTSRGLAKALSGSKSAVLFVASVGIEYDMLIRKYSRLSPLKALVFGAIGSERAEALCDTFCQEMGLTSPRFSAGYGDLPLEVQRDIFAVLNPEKHIGTSLNSSFLMTPTKSVSAFVGEKI